MIKNITFLFILAYTLIVTGCGKDCCDDFGVPTLSLRVTNDQGVSLIEPDSLMENGNYHNFSVSHVFWLKDNQEVESGFAVTNISAVASPRIYGS